MLNILRAVIQGLEATFENNGVGGMASAFQLLEIAHTHYCVKENIGRSDMSPLSERNSPLGGSRDSLASVEPNMTTSITSHVPSQSHLTSNLPSPSAGFVAQLGKHDSDEFLLEQRLSSDSQCSAEFTEGKQASFQAVFGANPNPSSRVAMQQPRKRRCRSAQVWKRCVPMLNKRFRRMHPSTRLW